MLSVIGRPEGFDNAITHWSAQQWLHAMGVERFSKAFVFAFVRDPRDRLLSAWSYLCQQKPSSKYWKIDERERRFVRGFDSFEQFVLKLPSEVAMTQAYQHLLAQVAYLATPRGEPGVNKLFRYEQIGEAWQELCTAFGWSRDLPHTNRSRHFSWHDVFSKEMDEIVKEVYAMDFALLGYE